MLSLLMVFNSLEKWEHVSHYNTLDASAFDEFESENGVAYNNYTSHFSRKKVWMACLVALQVWIHIFQVSDLLLPR